MHTVPCKVTGKCGSVVMRLIPAPRGTGIVSAPVPKKLLTLILQKTYSYLTLGRFLILLLIFGDFNFLSNFYVLKMLFCVLLLMFICLFIFSVS